MIIPVRCFSCGKVIGSSYEIYVKRVGMGESPKEVLDSLGIRRYCCRRMIISHADLIDEVIPFH
ncbi:MAG: DNA-directed RNA polymerase subunit N [Thermoplasmata archaeon]|uniref:DNA-directed RNA polymerase subunit Rpo10 n=1 Tax=Candidatus Sysuiplasma superficiale TaxID=2823368 RepID=A0A8J7YP66_9ARCH|nr:DNA-directed RNA polymerase subunit N [Candidatus Sysuiplasma superficiale]MBX8645015.1 DNA-directed RNA polymerase subunit N [Candidatus Sysuiplasma superficiale]MCL4346374.1 DNA-directed RNA polymerase subunit N [Candidatus Thermoplasmatota archaeon]